MTKREKKDFSSSQRSYALDTSFLIYAYYQWDEDTRKFIENGFSNLVTLSEVYYIICRKEGHVEAEKFIKEVIKTVRIVPCEELVLIAGQFKCKYPISLADCWVLATGKRKSVSVLFLIREKEIIDNLDEIQKVVKVEFFRK